MSACFVHRCFTLTPLLCFLHTSCVEFPCSSSHHTLHMTTVHHFCAQNQTKPVKLPNNFYIGQVFLKASHWFHVIFACCCGLGGFQRIQAPIGGEGSSEVLRTRGTHKLAWYICSQRKPMWYGVCHCVLTMWHHCQKCGFAVTVYARKRTRILVTVSTTVILNEGTNSRRLKIFYTQCWLLTELKFTKYGKRMLCYVRL